MFLRPESSVGIFLKTKAGDQSIASLDKFLRALCPIQKISRGLTVCRLELSLTWQSSEIGILNLPFISSTYWRSAAL